MKTHTLNPLWGEQASNPSHQRFKVHQFRFRPLVATSLTLVLMQGCGTEPEAPINPQNESSNPWDDYHIAPPSGDVLTTLIESPYLYPVKVCTPLENGSELLSSDAVEVDKFGQETICVWETTIGAAPEGIAYTEIADCKRSFSQGPSWFIEPHQRYSSDPSVLEDPKLVAELEWAKSQLESSGCACCHSSKSGSGNTTGFDVNAPQVWTDTIENYQLAMMTGEFEEHRRLGLIDPEDNHGFSRDHTFFPSTDPERLSAFFEAEFQRRNGTDDEWQEGKDTVDGFFERLKEPFSDCVSPWQGMLDSRVIWDSGRDVRQFYVLKTEAEAPGFPPSHDKPEGTVWAVYVPPDEAPISSGTIELGKLPEGAYQAVPEDGSAPVLIPGETYRLWATTDFMQIRELNCTITYAEPSVN